MMCDYDHLRNFDRCLGALRGPRDPRETMRQSFRRGAKMQPADSVARGTRETINDFCARVDLELPDGPMEPGDGWLLGAALGGSVVVFIIAIVAVIMTLSALFG